MKSNVEFLAHIIGEGKPIGYWFPTTIGLGPVGDGGLAHHVLGHYRPAPIIHGCSQAIWLATAALRRFETSRQPNGWCQSRLWTLERENAA